MLRFPAASLAGSRALARLGPRSRARQWLARWAVRSGWTAMARADLELVVTRYTHDCVSEPQEELVALGLPPRLEGHNEYRKGWSEFVEEWGEMHLTPKFFIDLGGRSVVLAHGHIRGAASGAEADFDISQLMELRHGQVAHERMFSRWADALDAAGIEPAVLERLEALDPRGVVELPARVLTKPD